MRNSSFHLLTLLAILLQVTTAFAGLLPQKAEFLPVHEAFIPSLDNPEPGLLRLRFEIADGYYLYRDRLALSSDDARLQLSSPQWPDGIRKEDDYFGITEVYYEELIADASYQSAAGDYRLDLKFQGCADAGLCYPPETVSIATPLTASTPAAPAQQVATPGPAPSSGQAQGFAMLSAASLTSTVLFFFLAGVGLALTPCVLPMVPILSSLIVNQREHPGKARSLLLSGVYVLAMATTFALAGVLVGYFGAGLNLQMHMQNPWILVPFAAVFAVLALSMFDLYHLRLPDAFAARIAPHESGHRSLWAAAGMGMASSLIVSPCVTAPLAAALLFISSTGEAATGGIALFALGLGMGAPLLLLGIGGERLLPKAGIWMNRVKQAFGVMLLGLAIWLLERILPATVILLAWSGLLIFCAVGLGALQPARGREVFRRAVGVFALMYGALLMIGAATGGDDPLAPLAKLAVPTTGKAANDAPARYRPINDVGQLQQALREATTSNRPVLLDVYADWCISCKVIEEEVLGDAAVRQALHNFVLLRADVTKNQKDDRELLQYLDLFGPPGLLVYQQPGMDLPKVRIIGEISAATMLDRLRSLQVSAQPGI